jgi:NhaP-type Na+/H+ or K+/H+ antiporter
MSSANSIRLWIIATILILAVVGLSTSEDPVTNQANASTSAPEKKPNQIDLFPEINLESIYPSLNVVMWILCALLVKNAYHIIPQVGKYLPESCFQILVGLVIGGFSKLYGITKGLTLSHELFFVYLLPPIIMNTGYSVPSRLFFDHLSTILVFAVFGTIWNSIAIGLSLWAAGLTGVFKTNLPFTESLLFATIISAIDPVAVLAIFEEIHVNDILYIIVVGN